LAAAPIVRERAAAERPLDTAVFLGELSSKSALGAVAEDNSLRVRLGRCGDCR